MRFLLVHHTAENTAHTAAQVPSILAAMYAFHTGPKGWHDIAYNFLVDREGGVWEGRAGSLAGPVAADATGGSQGFDQLVCFIGDFTSVTPTPAALDAGNRTLAWLAQRYSIDTSAGAKVTFVSRGSNKWPAGARVTTSTIAGHREMSTTACPGNAFYPYVRNQMQGAVQELRGGGVPAAPVTAPATTAAADDRAADHRRSQHHAASDDHDDSARDHDDCAIDDDHDAADDHHHTAGHDLDAASRDHVHGAGARRGRARQRGRGRRWPASRDPDRSGDCRRRWGVAVAPPESATGRRR